MFLFGISPILFEYYGHSGNLIVMLARFGEFKLSKRLMWYYSTSGPIQTLQAVLDLIIRLLKNITISCSVIITFK